MSQSEHFHLTELMQSIETLRVLALASLLAEAGRNCLFIMLKSGFIGFKRTLITGIYYESYSNQ